MNFRVIPSPVDLSEPLIYLWEVRDPQTGEVLYSYVGKAADGAGRPLLHYRRNVKNLLAGKPYRKGNPDGYRRVHRELAKAVRLKQLISLKFLCNVAPEENINEVERRLQQEHRR